jgi:putative hydrolase of HD superfamily
MNRLEEQMRFILEVDKLKSIVRQNYIIDQSRKEDDAEHSWHLALMCAVLSEYSNQKIDIVKTITMVLIHDIVEIDAGDTYAYDVQANASKHRRELAAANRVFQLLPEDQAITMRSLWDEFEEGNTPEAKFAITLDHIQPVLLNAESQGKSWREHQVKLSQIMNRNRDIHEGSEALWEYARKIIMENVKKNNIIQDDV